MNNLKTVSRFLIIFIIAYLFMVWPKTGIEKKYAEFFCYLGNNLFHEFGDNGIALLKTQKGKDNILLLVSNTSFIKEGQVTWQDYHKSSNMIGFLHTAFLLSLIIATPLSWKRKSIALAAGFFLITCYVMLKLRIIILYSYSISGTLGLSNDVAANESIAFWYNNFSIQFFRGYTFSVVLWLALCVGKKEWQKLNGMITEKVLNKKPVKKSPVNTSPKKKRGQ